MVEKSDLPSSRGYTLSSVSLWRSHQDYGVVQDVAQADGGLHVRDLKRGLKMCCSAVHLSNGLQCNSGVEVECGAKLCSYVDERYSSIKVINVLSKIGFIAIAI